MATLIANVTRGDRPGREWPVVERLRAIMGNADPSNRTGYEQTAADAISRIAELESALREIQGLIPKAIPNYSHTVFEVATRALER